MKYEYKEHTTYRGYGWIEPLMDSEDSLIEDYVTRRICEELNAMKDENDRLREALETAVSIANRAAILWDADQDTKAGKLMLALAGRIPKYSEETDAIHQALAAYRKQGVGND